MIKFWCSYKKYWWLWDFLVYKDNTLRYTKSFRILPVWGIRIALTINSKS